MFLEKGYRRAQIADIADAMGVAPGTVYLYVESKEALFDAVMRASTSPETVKTLQIPIKTPPPDATFSFIQKSLSNKARIASLEAALRAGDVRDGSVELEEIVRELYDKAARSWLSLKLMERSALDWPELAGLWFGKYRLRIVQQLSGYFEMRMASGDLRKAPDPSASARLVLEMIAAFAVHCRQDDPSPTKIDPSTAAATIVDAVVNAYSPRLQREGTRRTKGTRKT